jgi:hypothetical protein
MILPALLLALAAEPPAAAPPVTQHLHDVVVNAIRNCGQGPGDEITVCAKDRGFSEKYRIERLDKPTANLEESKIKLSGVADTGSAVPGGCTNIGQAGAMGCSKRDYQDWGAQKKQQKAQGRDYPW